MLEQEFSLYKDYSHLKTFLHKGVEDGRPELGLHLAGCVSGQVVGCLYGYVV